MNSFVANNELQSKVLLLLFCSLVTMIIGFMLMIAPTLLQKKHIVKFQLNNGEDDYIVQVKHNSIVSKMDDPIMEDYVFVGWALEDELYQFNTPVTSDITLEAIWNKIDEPIMTDEIIRYQVIFDSNGGSSIKSDMVIKYGLLNKPEDPIKEGYSFVGWKLNETYYDFSTKIISDITLVAEWKKNLDNNTDNKDSNANHNNTSKPSPTPDPTDKPSSSNTPSINSNPSSKPTKPTTSPTPIPTPKPSNTTKPSSNKVTGLSVTKTLTLEKGKSNTLKVSYTPSDAKLTKLTWSSSNTSVATVSSSGKITTKKVGTAIITVKDKLNNTAKCTVTVIQQPTSISLSETNINIKPGETKKILHSFFPYDTTEKGITWSSSNTRVASVSQSGVVTGVSFGTTTITARTNNGKTASLTVNVDPGRLELLKDTKFNNGLQLWMDTNEQNYKCVNCKGQQYWYIGSWNFPPKFVNSYYENGEYVINANQADGTNNKLITYNNNGELSLTFNSFGMNYGTSASGWPHLLLDGMLGTSNKQWYFNQYSAIEQKYHSFTGNDIWYHVDVKLNYYTKGQPINGVQALQYLSYLEIHDKKVPSNTVWFGFNLFDDRAANQGSYTMMDEYTQNYIYHLGTTEVYGSMGNSIYNNGNFVYSQWRSVNINLSNYIDDVVKIINQKNLFGRAITQDDLFVSAVNIGFEIHGEYHASMSMKNLQITSIKK